MSAELPDFNPETGHRHMCSPTSPQFCRCAAELYTLAARLDETARRGIFVTDADHDELLSRQLPDDTHNQYVLVPDIIDWFDALKSRQQPAEPGAGQILRTAEEVEQLPEGSVIADRHDDVWQRCGGVWCSYETTSSTSAHIHAKWAPLTVLRRGGAA